MAREPDDRFPTTTELADKLTVFADDDPDRTAALVTTGSDLETIAFTQPEPSSELVRRSSRHAAPPARRRAAPRPATGRIASRMLLPAIGVLVFAGGLVAALMTGALETTPDTVDGATGAPTANVALPIAELSAFDPPPGNGRERDDDLPNLVDGDASTLWTTEGYRTADFGGLKEGVGFVIDLGQPQTVEAVHLTLQTPGLNISLFASDAVPTTAPEGAIAQVTQVQTQDQPRAELRPAEPVQARHLLVWITGPLPAGPPSENPFRAALAEVTVQGAPDDAEQ
jgi:hypothetical protein